MAVHCLTIPKCHSCHLVPHLLSGPCHDMQNFYIIIVSLLQLFTLLTPTAMCVSLVHHMFLVLAYRIPFFHHFLNHPLLLLPGGIQLYVPFGHHSFSICIKYPNHFNPFLIILPISTHIFFSLFHQFVFCPYSIIFQSEIKL
jgi:hypothetical protein